MKLTAQKQMKTIALITEKGGTGKSTIAVHLAIAARRQGKIVAVIDLDPQASAQLWCQRRGGQDLAVVSARPPSFPACWTKPDGRALILS